jgi:hypothetical protein
MKCMRNKPAPKAKQSLRPAYRVSNEHIEMKIATQPQDVGHRVFLTKHYRLQS